MLAALGAGPPASVDELAARLEVGSYFVRAQLRVLIALGLVIERADHVYRGGIPGRSPRTYARAPGSAKGETP